MGQLKNNWKGSAYCLLYCIYARHTHTRKKREEETSLRAPTKRTPCKFEWNRAILSVVAKSIYVYNTYVYSMYCIWIKWKRSELVRRREQQQNHQKRNTYELRSTRVRSQGILWTKEKYKIKKKKKKNTKKEKKTMKINKLRNNFPYP